MKFLVEIEKEEDGRWIADVPELPGVMAYGRTSTEAAGKAQALALRVIAERIEHGESASNRLVRQATKWVSPHAFPIRLAGLYLFFP